MQRNRRSQASFDARAGEPATAAENSCPPRAPSSCARSADPAERSPPMHKPQAADLGLQEERVTRIELALSAWEADVLPLNYTRVRRRRSRCANGRHFTSCQAPGVDAEGPEGVSGAGRGCGQPELGRTVGAWARVRAGPECRLEGCLFHPVLWLLSSGKHQPDAALGEGTLGLDGAHRRPLCRWARVQYRFVPDAAGRAARPRPAAPVSAMYAASERRARQLPEAVVSGSEQRTKA